MSATLIALSLLATEAPTALGPAERLAYVEEQLSSARVKRTLGISMVTGGALLLVAGGVLQPFAVAQGQRHDISNAAEVQATWHGIGLAIAGVGALAFGIGLPFWIAGGREMSHYARKKDEILLTLTPIPGGALLTARL